MGAQWLPWQPRGPLAANPQRRPCHKSSDTFWYIRPDVSYKWLQWPHLTSSSGRFFQKVTHRWAVHRNQLLVRTGTLKCLAKPNPAAIPSNDLLLSKNPANEPILVNCYNEVIKNESKLPVWTTATLTRLHKWYLISSPWTPIAPQMTYLTPSICKLQLAPMTPFDTIIWPILRKGNRSMSRPQKSTPGPNRDSKVPS